MTGQRVAHVRVSALDQNTVRQLDGAATDRVFTEKASGKDQNRPDLATPSSCTRWIASHETSMTCDRSWVG